MFNDVLKNRMYMRDVVSIADLTREDLELIVQVAALLKKSPKQNFLDGKVIASCFFEASTRTRLSFETAINRLKGEIIGFSDASNTSFGKKGETLSDSIRMLSGYADAIVMRHPQEGSARLAAEVCGSGVSKGKRTPVINGGDGANQHPTQTLLDLFSIFETQGTLDNLQVAFVGDLKYGRTVHSLAQALSLFNATFYFVAPTALQMPEYLLEELEQNNINFEIVDNIDEVIPKVDILYMTRVQKERFDPTEYMHIASQFVLHANMLEGKENQLIAKDNLKVLHPLPRVDEIDISVDETKYAYYFQQAENGVYAREALLSLVLNESLDVDGVTIEKGEC